MSLLLLLLGLLLFDLVWTYFIGALLGWDRDRMSRRVVYLFASHCSRSKHLAYGIEGGGARGWVVVKSKCGGGSVSVVERGFVVSLKYALTKLEDAYHRRVRWWYFCQLHKVRLIGLFLKLSIFGIYYFLYEYPLCLVSWFGLRFTFWYSHFESEGDESVSLTLILITFQASFKIFLYKGWLRG